MADNLQLNAEVALVALLLNQPELWPEIDASIKAIDLKHGQNSQRVYEVGLELAKVNQLTKPVLIEQVGNEKLVEKYLGFDHNVDLLDNYVSIVLTGQDLAKYDIRQQLTEYQREIERNKSVPIEERVFRPSLIDVTKKLGGLYRGEMSVTGGRPGMGKTGLALQNSKEFGIPKRKSVYVGLEMSSFRMLDRMMASDADILLFEEIIELSYAGNPVKEKDFLRSFANLHKNQMYIVTSDRSNDVSDYKNLRKLILGYLKLGARYFTIDNVNLMKWSEVNTSHRNYELECILGDIVGICTSKDYGYPHINIVAHLNRQCEQRPDKRPQKSDLKDTGSLEQLADVVKFIYRDGYYNPDSESPNVAEIIIEKNRNRLTPALAKVYWDGAKFTFRNLQHDSVI